MRDVDSLVFASGCTKKIVTMKKERVRNPNGSGEIGVHAISFPVAVGFTVP
jgi:hypothetical protein